MLVNVVHIREEDNNVTRIRLDLSSKHQVSGGEEFTNPHHLACRFVRAYCDFPKYDETDGIAVHFWTRLIEFFTTEYLDILESAQYHIIYHFDIRWPQTVGLITGTTIVEEGYDEQAGEWTGAIGGDGSIGQTTTTTTSWTEITQTMDMQGFDQIIAITQSGLNAYFRNIFSAAQSSKTDNTLATWSYDEFFSASFQPINVRLLSHNKAIVWIHLRDGYLKTLRNWLPWAEYVNYPVIRATSNLLCV